MRRRTHVKTAGYAWRWTKLLRRSIFTSGASAQTTSRETYVKEVGTWLQQYVRVTNGIRRVLLPYLIRDSESGNREDHVRII